MVWLKCAFETYFEVDDLFWRQWQAGAKNVFVCRILWLCRKVWCFVDCADIQQYILHGWHNGAKHFFICRIVTFCRRVWCCVERTDMQRYCFWPGLFVPNYLVYITGWPESDTLIDRLVGDFCHIEGLRDWWEYQGGKNQKDEEGAGFLYVRQYGVSVTNNKGVN